jgi:hypothetical protein
MKVCKKTRRISVGFDKDLLGRINYERKLTKLSKAEFIRQSVLQWTNHLMQQRDLAWASNESDDAILEPRPHVDPLEMPEEGPRAGCARWR